MTRQDIAQFLQDVIGFGSVLEARQGASKSVELRISAHQGDGGKDWCEWWGAPTVAFLPTKGDEVMYLDLGSERIVIAVKSRQFQQDLETGECIVRATGAPEAAYAKLKPDGTIELHGARIDLGGEALATLIARADRADANYTTLQSNFDTHSHLTAGTGSPVPPTVLIGPLPSCAADKVYGS